MSTHSTAPGCSLLTPIMRWWGAAGAGRRQDQPITHRCRYSGVFSCQPVRWFPPAQVLQYANMLAACDGCSAVCRLQVRNAMLQLGRWIIIIIGSGLFSHQACILQLRHSAHCSAATLAVVIITQSIITLFISKPYPSSHYFGRQAKYQCLNKENRYAELLMTL